MNSKWLTIGRLFVVAFFSHSSIADDAFDSWKKKQETSFNHYLTQEQAAFKKALASDWQNFKLSQPRQLFKEPKFDTPPVAPIEPDKSVDPLLPSEPIAPKPIAPKPTVITKPKVEPIVPDLVPNVDPARIPNQIDVEYLGTQFLLPKIQPSYLPLKADNKVIAQAWESLYPDLSLLSITVKEDAKYSNLSDWALISLMEKYALSVNRKDPNGSQLFLWAALLELGYDARLAYDDRFLYVLLPSKQKIYGKLSLHYSGLDYYVLTGKKPGKSLYSYKADQTQNTRFDFEFSSIQPVNGLKAEQKTLSDETTGLTVEYLTYPQLKNYYRTHPALDFVWYFKATPKDSHYLQLVESLKIALVEHSETEKVQALLSLIQHGFEYQRDHEQWGEEYYATPMHTLMLDAVDCEDRSFLFSYLVKEVVGLDTIGLKYPGHLAVAVALDEAEMNAGSDYVEVAGRKFFVTDPTYIGARIGKAMPMFNNVVPTVILER